MRILFILHYFPLRILHTRYIFPFSSTRVSQIDDTIYFSCADAHLRLLGNREISTRKNKTKEYNKYIKSEKIILT